MSFSEYFRSAMKCSLLTGIALGLLLLTLTLAGITLNGNVDLELDTDLADGFLSLVLFPALLCLLTLLASPVVFLMLWLVRQLRGRSRAA